MAVQYFRHELKPMAESCNGCFDCNICLDFAKEPIVTLCGHLYCWACIYKWLHVQSASLASDEHPQCPVCKADICHTTMVPLYARGQANSGSPDESVAAVQLGMLIPPRPPACAAAAALSSAPRSGQQLPYRNPYQNQGYHHHQDDQAGLGLQHHHHPVVGMLYATAFGNSDGVYAAAAAYPSAASASSYRLMGSATPRLRRQEMQADKSLNRVSIFLFCCLLLCIIMF